MDTELESARAVERMKDYIRRHLKEPVTAREVAEAAGYSQYHAARLFKSQTGLTPFEYIRQERLTASAHALRGQELRILDVALDFVFDSQEGFTRAFSRGFGISPGRFAAQSPPAGWLIQYRYLKRTRQKSEVSEMERNQTAVIFTQILQRPARWLILKRSSGAEDYFSYVEEVGCGEHHNSAAWDRLTEIREALYEPVGLWLPENMQEPGTGSYAHGAEVPESFSGQVPAGFDIIDLPPCQLLVFHGEPYDDEDFERAVGLAMERIQTFNPEVYGYRYAPRLAPRMQLAPQGWRGYIELVPVESMT